MERAFPTLFPDGKYGLKDEREIKLNPSEFIKHCFHWHDRRFRNHPLFIHWAMNRL